jgi:hypothetical protein
VSYILGEDKVRKIEQCPIPYGSIKLQQTYLGWKSSTHGVVSFEQAGRYGINWYFYGHHILDLPEFEHLIRHMTKQLPTFRITEDTACYSAMAGQLYWTESIIAVRQVYKFLVEEVIQPALMLHDVFGDDIHETFRNIPAQESLRETYNRLINEGH